MEEHRHRVPLEVTERRLDGQRATAVVPGRAAVRAARLQGAAKGGGGSSRAAGPTLARCHAEAPWAGGCGCEVARPGGKAGTLFLVHLAACTSWRVTPIPTPPLGRAVGMTNMTGVTSRCPLLLRIRCVKTRGQNSSEIARQKQQTRSGFNIPGKDGTANDPHPNHRFTH